MSTATSTGATIAIAVIANRYSFQANHTHRPCAQTASAWNIGTLNKKKKIDEELLNQLDTHTTSSKSKH